MKIIIPMSGIGKRFIDAGYIVPKPLIQVEGKPIIEHVVNLFDKENDDYIFICNDTHLKETNMREILMGIVPHCKIYEVSVNHRRGPVDAVLQIAEQEINDNDEIIISYCDYGTLWNYTEFKREIKKYNIDGAIPAYIGFHPHSLGSDNYAFIKETNKDFISIQEKKPYTDNKMNEYASNGTYYFKSGKIVKQYFTRLVELNISINNEFYCSMVYNLMKADNLTIRVFEIEKMLQWGTPKDLEEYVVWSTYFLNRNMRFNAEFIDKWDTTLLLPMAGAGSRFSKEGYDIPKPLLDIEGLPMIIRAVDCLPQTTNKIFICQKEHPIGDTITNHYSNAHIIGIDYITEGQACTCDIAFQQCDIDMEKPLLISACDNGVYYDITKYEKLIEDDSVDIIIWSFSDNPASRLFPQMYAWLDVDDNNYIKRVSVKKPFDDVPNKYAIIGTMTFKRAKYFKEGLARIYETECKTNGEYYVDNMIEPLIKMGYRIKIFNVDNYLCWGTPNDYKTYNYWKDYFMK